MTTISVSIANQDSFGQLTFLNSSSLFSFEGAGARSFDRVFSFRLSVNSWGKSEKNRIRVKDKRWLASCRLFIIIRELVGKYMKDTVSESIEILVTVSDSFEYFDFVVTAFGKAVCNR